MAITVRLTAYNMGQVDKIDFDCWASFVVDKIAEATGIEIAEVDCFPFGGGPDRDEVDGATDEQRQTIVTWLAVDGWEDFCGNEWNRRRELREVSP